MTMKVIFTKDCEIWTAQCLEFDISAQGVSMDDAAIRFEAALLAESVTSKRLMGEVFKGIPEAPKSFFDLWDKCSEASQKGRSSPINGKEVDLEYAIAC